MTQTRVAPRHCHLCGERLLGRYYRYETGLIVCGTCQATRPACARCGVPVPTAGAGSPPLCATCARTASRCAVCQQVIVGTYYTFEEMLPIEAPRQFCAACVQTRPRCDLCRAPVALSARPLEDGQFRCTLCSSSMVLGRDTVANIYHLASREVEAITGMSLQIPRLEIVGRRRMGEIRREHGREQTVAAEETGHFHVLGYFVFNGTSTTIYIELGLPRPLLLGTLAHELSHAWQATYAPDIRDPLIVEGFAEWVSHATLLRAGQVTLAARATRRNDIYGKGLRHFLALESQGGRAAVLTAARRTS